MPRSIATKKSTAFESFSILIVYYTIPGRAHQAQPLLHLAYKASGGKPDSTAQYLSLIVLALGALGSPNAWGSGCAEFGEGPLIIVVINNYTNTNTGSNNSSNSNDVNTGIIIARVVFGLCHVVNSVML